jgi:hypothetical protein
MPRSRLVVLAALRSLCGTQHARVVGDKHRADSIVNPRRTREDLQLMSFLYFIIVILIIIALISYIMRRRR